MMVPKGSMWAMGLSVKRPARLAVSSPNMLATHPCETSCRMIDGNNIAKKTMRSCVIGGPERPALPLRSAVDAVAGGRLGLQAGGGGGVTPGFAEALNAAFQLAPG